MDGCNLRHFHCWIQSGTSKDDEKRCSRQDARIHGKLIIFLLERLDPEIERTRSYHRIEAFPRK